tara:strand:- start:735 stop:875 length:141 start_codon:yes stop_codon:yes gene_type:complete
MKDFFNCIADIFQETFKIIPIIGEPLNWVFIGIGSFVFILCAKKFI